MGEKEDKRTVSHVLCAILACGPAILQGVRVFRVAGGMLALLPRFVLTSSILPFKTHHLFTLLLLLAPVVFGSFPDLTFGALLAFLSAIMIALAHVLQLTFLAPTLLVLAVLALAVLALAFLLSMLLLLVLLPLALLCLVFLQLAHPQLVRLLPIALLPLAVVRYQLSAPTLVFLLHMSACVIVRLVLAVSIVFPIVLLAGLLLGRQHLET